METLRVPAFKPGRYRVICHVTGEPRWVEYTAADVASVIKNGNAQLSAGLSCPMTWMHDLSAKPDQYNRDKWIAKEWFANPARWEYDAATGEAVAVAQVDDPTDAKRAEKLKWVSPSIVYDYVDQLGRKWPGASALHIAATPQPIQIGLTPISKFTAYRQTLLSRQAAGAVWLSYGTGVTRMHNEEEEVVAEGMAPDGDAVVADVAAEAPDDGMADLNDIVGLFAKFGVEVPEGDFASMKELRDAIEANVNMVLAGKGTDDMGAMGKNKPDHLPATSPPVLMSVAPSVPAHAAFVTQDATSKRDKYRDRINQLAVKGKITVELRDAALADLDRVNLSVDSHRFYDSQFTFHEPPIAAKISAWEELPDGRFSHTEIERRTRQAANLSIKAPTSAVPAPAGENAEVDGEYMLRRMAQKQGISLEEARKKVKRPG